VEGLCEDAADAGEAVTFSGPRDVTMSCRPSAITRALSNLIDNAVKYGKTGTVTLIAEPSSITINVEDEGPGIPRAEREKVFEPFYRADTSRDPSMGGIGLGLAVTRSIVAEHGGRILLSNRKGGGLRVRLEFPLQPSTLRAARREQGHNVDRADDDAPPDGVRA
jgi:signal transduction histidine kinase